MIFQKIILKIGQTLYKTKYFQGQIFLYLILQIIILSFLLLSMQIRLLITSYNHLSKTMNSDESFKQILSKAEKTHNRSRTSCLELENLLYYQELQLGVRKSVFWLCKPCRNERTIVNLGFKRAFKTLSDLEKAKFYLHCVQSAEHIIFGPEIKSQKNMRCYGKHCVDQRYLKKKQKQKNMKTFAYIKDIKNSTEWTNVQIEIFKKDKILRICQMNECFDLHHYIFRKSHNKRKNSIVLQSTVKEYSSIRLSSNQDFYNLIEELVKQAQFQNIQRILNNQNKFPKHKKVHNYEYCKSLKDFEEVTSTQENKKSEYILSSEAVCIEQKYQNKQIIKKQIFLKQILNQLDDWSRFDEVDQKIYLEKGGKRLRKVFFFCMEESLENKLIQILLNPHLSEIKSDSDIKLIFQKFQQKTKVFQQICYIFNSKIHFKFQRMHCVWQGINYFFDTSIKQKKVYLDCIEGKIKYCVWRIKSFLGKIQLLVEAKIKYEKNIPSQVKATCYYIGNFYNVAQKYVTSEIWNQEEVNISFETEDFENQSLQQISKQSEVFYTVNGSDFYEQEFPKKIIQLHKVPVDNKKQSMAIISETQRYLIRFYPQEPYPKIKSRYISTKFSYWFLENNWEIIKNNKVMQKNIFSRSTQESFRNYYFQNLKKTFFWEKKKTLPIQSLGSISNLERLSMCLCFAPNFLQRASRSSSVFDRFVHIICFGLGFMISLISKMKPFNPVLGQTFQGMIDGCPIYAEQIRQHPPTGSFLLKGRGYSVHSSLISRHDQRVKSIREDLQGNINIIFNNHNFENQRVYFSLPSIQLLERDSDERELQILGKSVFIDEQNRLYLLINWGQSENEEKCKGEKADYFEGEAVKIVEGIDFTEKNFKLHPHYIEHKYGSIFGNWTQDLYFSEFLMFKTRTDLPYMMEQYSPCLPSDSRFRKDIIKKKQKDMQSSQMFNEELLKSQIRDQQLRSKK